MSDKENSYVLTNNLKERYIEVPVSAVTRKYFLTVSKSQDGFVRARLDSMLGMTMAIGTERDIYRKRKIRRKPTGHKIKVVLSERLEHGKIKEKTLISMGILLDKVFRECFFMYVRGAAKTGCSDNYAVNCFMDEFGITEDEWSVDTAKKAYRDYMERAPGFDGRKASLRKMNF